MVMLMNVGVSIDLRLNCRLIHKLKADKGIKSPDLRLQRCLVHKAIPLPSGEGHKRRLIHKLKADKGIKSPDLRLQRRLIHKATSLPSGEGRKRRLFHKLKAGRGTKNQTQP